METVHRRIAVHNGRSALAYVQPLLEQRGGIAVGDDDDKAPAPINKGYIARAWSALNFATVTGIGDSIEEAVDDVAQRI